MPGRALIAKELRFWKFGKLDSNLFLPNFDMKTIKINKNFQAFVKLDRRKYLDNYIVIIDGKVRFSGKDIKKMLREVRKKYPNKTPLVAKIPKEEVMVLIIAL